MILPLAVLRVLASNKLRLLQYRLSSVFFLLFINIIVDTLPRAIIRLLIIIIIIYIEMKLLLLLR